MGCRWDRDRGVIGESLRWTQFDRLPIILMIPRSISKLKQCEEGMMNKYECPLYITEERRDRTVMPSNVIPDANRNFIMYLNLPCTENGNHWLIRSAASLCQLND